MEPLSLQNGIPAPGRFVNYLLQSLQLTNLKLFTNSQISLLATLLLISPPVRVFSFLTTQSNDDHTRHGP